MAVRGKHSRGERAKEVVMGVVERRERKGLGSETQGSVITWPWLPASILAQSLRKCKYNGGYISKTPA